jgi:hypothetical protein
MRLAAAIAVFACAASAALAQDARENRYGPRAEREASAQTASLAYTGPMLGWAGKPPIAAPAPAPLPALEPAPVAVSRSEPVAPWRKPDALPTAPPPAAQAVALRPPAPLPQSLYAQPAAAPAPQPAMRQTLAAAPSPPTADALGPSLSRTYSVGRQYGLQPDALPPLKPNGMVFIAPSDAPATARADAPRHGSAEWLAGGPLGDEADRNVGKDLSLR